MWRKIEPKIAPVEKKRQISCMLRGGLHPVIVRKGRVGGQRVSLELKYLQSATQVWSISWRCQEKKKRGIDFVLIFSQSWITFYVEQSLILQLPSPTLMRPSITLASNAPTFREQNEVLLFSSSIFSQDTGHAVMIRKIMRICFHCCCHHVHISSSQVSLVQDPW